MAAGRALASMHFQGANAMGRFLRHLVAFLGLQILVAGAFVSGWRTEHHYLRATQLKHDALDRTPSPRILLVGGSSVGFGLRSEMLQQAFGMPTINLGLHAGIYRDFILNEAEAAVGPGDVVLVMLEYEHYGVYAPSIDLLRVAYFRPTNLWYYSGRDWAFAGDNGLGFLSKLVNAGVMGRLQPPVNPDMLLYRLGSFNEHGDVVVDRPSIFQAMGDALPVAYPRTDEAIARLNRLHSTCQARGAKLFLGYPPFAKTLTQHGLAATRELDQNLRKGLSFPALWHPEDSFYPTDWFLDTRYHLVDRAAKQHTALVVEALRPHLQPNESTPTHRTDPTLATAPLQQEVK